MIENSKLSIRTHNNFKFRSLNELQALSFDVDQISSTIITAVTGAPIIAPPTAAIPQKGITDPALINPKAEIIFPTIEPVAVPMNNAGANMPPNSPELKQIDVIKILRIRITIKKPNKKFPLSIWLILSVPRPNTCGKNIPVIPQITAPE